MLTYDDALNMNYYKKTSYTGWMGGMRFLLKKDVIVEEQETPEKASDETEPVPPIETTVFHAWVWPGPYIFSATDDAKKTDQTFTFDEDGRRAAVDWINAQYEERIAEWPKSKMDTRNM